MKKINKKNQIRMRMRLSKILLCILAIVLCAAPCAGVQYFSLHYDEVGEYDVTVDEINKARGDADLEKNGVLDWLDVGADTIVNLYASVEDCVFVHPDSVLNIYSGSVGLYVIVSPDEPNAVVTVYGTNFEVDLECNGTFVSLDGATEFKPRSSGSVLTGTYSGNGGAIELCFLSDDIPIKLKETDSKVVAIDIKPGGNPNNINPKSKGVVPVAVLTTDGFDAGNIDPTTVEFAGASPVRWKLEDVDDDGDLDILFHFKTQELFENDLNEDSTEAMLTATLIGTMTSTITRETTGGEVIQGTDKVWIVPGKNK